MKLVCTALSGILFLILALPGYAQETYFNVSESEITEKNKILVQQQVDISDQLRSSTTFNYGLGRNWEIGANLFNANYKPDRKQFVRNDTSNQMPYAPLLLLNVQKVFELTNNLLIGIGAQGGANLTPNKGRSRLVGYAYVNLAGSFQQQHYKWSVGPYASHSRFLGGKSQIGLQAGFDAGIFYEKLHLISDWISGQHDLGQLVVGLEVFLGKKLPLSIGWQRANQDGSQGVVVQLSYIPQQ
jgi:hypothetical protein